MVQPNRRTPPIGRGGFTLIELLVVIMIIGVLIGLLFPVISRVRRAGWTTDTKAFMSQLEGGIQRYYSEFHAYPGPVPNDECGYNPANTANYVYLQAKPGVALNKNMTGAENLALGLLGGLYWNATTGQFEVDIQRMLSGKGPTSLNQVGVPKSYEKFVDAKNLYTGPDPTNAMLTTGYYRDGAGWALNTEIPEFVDRFPSAMPFLYMRANVGAQPPPTPFDPDKNPIVTRDRTAPPNPKAQYDLRHIIGYTSNLGPNPDNRPPELNYIGESKTLPKKYFGPNPKNKAPAHGLQSVDPTASMDKASANYVYPYDAYAYFSHPSLPNTARSKDGYILISAGPDRLYGTEDDICNFGPVLP